jgi:hypothetical protein
MLARLRLGPRLWSRRRQPLLFQHPPHRGRRGPESKVALQHIADAPAPGTRLCPLRRHDRLTRRPRHPGRRPYPPTAARQQSRLALRPITPHPLRHGGVRHPEPRRDRMRARAPGFHLPHYRQHHVRRPAPAVLARHAPASARSLVRSFVAHLSSPLPPGRQAKSRTGARTLSTRSSAHEVARTAALIQAEIRKLRRKNAKLHDRIASTNPLFEAAGDSIRTRKYSASRPRNS